VDLILILIEQLRSSPTITFPGAGLPSSLIIGMEEKKNNLKKSGRYGIQMFVVNSVQKITATPRHSVFLKLFE
jgi:hypothetical protein